MSDRESMDNGHSPNGHRSDNESEASDNGRSPRPVDRSNSRSRSNSPKRNKRHSRSRSRSYERNNRRPGSNRRSRSPGRRQNRQNNNTEREAPPAGRCLGVFGLSIHTHQRDLEEVFGKYGSIEDVQIVFDAQTGRSRGFAFVYFKDKNSALEAKNKCNGIDINGRQIRVDFSITQRAHTPTPGIYMGRPSNPKHRRDDRRDNRFDRDRRDGFRGRDNFRERDRDFRRRSPSPNYRNRDRSPRARGYNRY